MLFDRKKEHSNIVAPVLLSLVHTTNTYSLLCWVMGLNLDQK